MAQEAKRTMRRQSLAWRILLWMSIAALGPLLVMAIQGYHCAREAIIDSEEAHLLSVLESRRTRVNAWLKGIDSDLRLLAISPSMGAPRDQFALHAAGTRRAELRALLEDLRTASPFYRAIAAFDAGWKPVVQSGEPRSSCCMLAVDESGRSREPFVPPLQIRPDDCLRTRLDAEDTVVWVSLVDSAGVLPTLQVGRRVPEVGGDASGFLVAEIAVPEIVDPILFDRTGLRQTGRVYVRTPAGRYPAARRQIAEPAADSTRVSHYMNADGHRVLGAAAALPALSWTLVAEVEEAEAFAWLGVLRRRALVTGLITMLVVAALATAGARRLASPLKQLAGVARRIAAGDAGERVGALEGAEAAEVGEAFNRMLDELAIAQERLRQAASLAAVGQLSSSIVHEMRNPLSSVKMNLQALKQKVADDPLHAELAAIAAEQVDRLETMLGELLSYGRPLELNLESLRVAEVIRDACDVVASHAQEKKIAVTARCHPADLIIRADREQLRRALSNLILNAIQASASSQEVTVQARADQDDERQVRISVEDQGGGISARDMARLFRPFFTTREEGTGLGLATVKKVVDYHGGAVWAENRTPQGARFTLLLPGGRGPDEGRS